MAEPQHDYAEPLTEVIMSMLPVVVVGLVVASHGTIGKLLEKPEFAFGAAILFGQALVRLFSALTAPHARVKPPKVTLFAACVLVFGLVPSLLVLVLAIDSAEGGKSIPVVLQATQVVLFFLAALAFVVIGAVSHGIRAR